MSRVLLEVCIDNAAGLSAAIAGGADRIELCSALTLGGLTPSKGIMKLASQAAVPVYAMIRPREGNFVYSKNEIEIMCGDIDQVRECGLSGIVVGASNADGTLNASQLRILAARASRLGITLHRAFDLASDYRSAMDVAIELGFERILTSGGAKRATDGIARLIDCVAHAAGRIKVMPGGGIDAASAAIMLKKLPLQEVHASCSSIVTNRDLRLLELGFATFETKATDQLKVEALSKILHAHSYSMANYSVYARK